MLQQGFSCRVNIHQGIITMISIIGFEFKPNSDFVDWLIKEKKLIE